MSELSEAPPIHVGTVSATAEALVGSMTVASLLLHTDEAIPAIQLKGVHTTADYRGTSYWGDDFLDGRFASTAPESGYFLPTHVSLQTRAIHMKGSFLRLNPSPRLGTDWGHVSNEMIRRYPSIATEASPLLSKAIALAGETSLHGTVQWILYHGAVCTIPKLGRRVSPAVITKEEYFSEE